jgi:hypothetical protein
VTELTNLVTALDARHLPITRVMLNIDAWDSHPRRISVDGRIVKLGWFATLEAGLLIASTNTERRLDLMLIPPDTATGPATAAMAMASDSANTFTASAVLAAAGSASDVTA